MKYPLATTSWDKKEINAMKTVLKSGNYTMGVNVAEYEKRFAEYVGSKYCVMVNSGSSANLLMIGALFFCSKYKLKTGDEVIVPAVSWPTTYYPLAQYGLKLKFVDIDVHTLNFNVSDLEKAITSETKAILAVNLLGNPNDFKVIKNLINNKKILLLEDNCESLGALFEGKQTGTFGLMGTYSSFFSHHISTMEGGTIVTDDEELYHILLSLRAHGWTRNLPEQNKVTGTKSENSFEESFKFVLPGYNFRPLELEGAIGIEQLKKLPQFIKKRIENASYFKEKFSNSKYFMIQKEIGISSWFGFSFVIKKDFDLNRLKIVNKLVEKGIDSRPIVAGNFTKNPVINYFDYEMHGAMNNADYIDKNGFFVGNHHYPIKKEIDYLYKVLSEI